MENSNVLLQVLGLLAAIFTGFFTLFKVTLNKVDKINERFFLHVDKKNEHIERMSNKFTDTVYANQKVISELSDKVGKMNDNDGMVIQALNKNTSILNQTIKVLELHEQNTTLRHVKEMRRDEINADQKS